MFIFIFISLCISIHSINTKQDLYTVYAHGIVDSAAQIQRFTEAITTDPIHTKTVTFTDTQPETGYDINRTISQVTTLLKKPINRSKMYMGQGKDLESLHQEIAAIPVHSNIVLYGCSRGAATIIKYLSKQNLDSIKAVVLDASPANMISTIHPLLAKLGIAFSHDVSLFTTLFPAYPTNATTPLESIKNIKNKNLPILLIHSEDDKNVPFLHALQLYYEFMQCGFKHVYLVRIPKGKHSFLLQDPSVKDIYLTAVHSFYKQHNLPYDHHYAQNDMKQYQPAASEILKEITQLERNLYNHYQNSKSRNMLIAGLSTAILLAYWYYKRQMPN